MSARERILVTGAEEHQGLAVIRGLGRAGFPVIAGGTARHSIGFHSRYAVETACYTSPFADQGRFLDEIEEVLRRTRPALLIPAVESTLVVLNEARPRIERFTRLAAPPAEVLDYAIDKGKTLTLAEGLGVPVPRTAQGETTDQVLDQASRLQFPVAVKPRGHGLHLSTANSLGFKVRYARTPDELRRLLLPHGHDAGALLVQEYTPGMGRCVAAVCRHGTALALFAYEREREFPLSGGVSVLRRSIPLDDRLRNYTTTLLDAIHWHGVAMVEFKYDDRADRYTLMEINGRFQASTALSLEAGLNLPALVAELYLNHDPAPVSGYRVGVRERWLRGDLMALRDGLAPASQVASTRAPLGKRAHRLAVLGHFLWDFRPGINFDEFKWSDWEPGVVEAAGLVGLLGRWLGDSLRAVLRLPPYLVPWLKASASARAQRSMRA